MARALDAVTVFFVLWMLAVLQLLGFVSDLADRFSPEPWGRALVPTLVFCVAWGVYEVVFLRYNDGQTPGKDFLDIRVVRRIDGNDPSVLRAALRWLIPGAATALVWPVVDWPVAPLALTAATAVTALFDTQHRAVHDHLTGTIVVHYRHRSDDSDSEDDLDEPDLDGASPAGSTIVSEMLFGRLRRRR